MSILAVKNAVLARLREDPELAQSVFEGVVTTAPGAARPNRYVALFTNSGARSASRFTGPSSQSVQTFVLHSVGTKPDQAQFVADRVFAKLLDWTPTVDGLSFRRVTHEASLPLARDDDTSPPLFYQVDEFDLTYEAL